MTIINGLHGFAFRGKHSSEFGIILNKLQRSILPPQSERLIEIPDKAGAHFFGKQKGVREFKLDITISGKSEKDYNEKVREVAVWLNSDIEQEIVFDREPDKSYYGFFTGTTDLEELQTIGTTSLVFLCPDPYAYAPEVDTNLIESPQVVKTGGKEETFPAFKVTFKKPSTFFTVGTKDKHIFVGKNAADLEVAPANERTLAEPMSTTTGWQVQSTLDPDTDVTGEFQSNGYSFSPKSYGTGSKWHGPALKKMASRPVQDFSLLAHVGMFTSRQSDVGKVEIHLLDANSNPIGRMCLYDSTGYAVSSFMARAGNAQNGKVFCNYEGTVRTETQKVKVVNKVNGKDVTTYKSVNYKYGSLRDFRGDIVLERVENRWHAIITKKDSESGKAIWMYHWRFTDTENKYMAKVAGAAVHVATHGASNTMKSIFISRLVLEEKRKLEDNQIQEIFHEGDELHISTEDGSVLLNGAPYLEDVDLSSQFFPLEGGSQNQEVAYAPADKVDVIMSHRPRYL